MIVKSYSVFCDVEGPNCRGWIAQTTTGARDARREARRAGWRRTDGKDICPACQPPAAPPPRVERRLEVGDRIRRTKHNRGGVPATFVVLAVGGPKVRLANEQTGAEQTGYWRNARDLPAHYELVTDDRRTHPRVHDWTDHHRNDRRLT